MASNQQGENQSIVVLTCNDAKNPHSSEQTIIVVGTAHLSSDSCKQVRDIIKEKKPQAIFLELCRERQDIVLRANADIREPTLDDLIKMWRKGKSTLEILYSWVMGRFGEENRMPGEEFRAATQEAKGINAMVILGDRPISITMSRMWASLTSWQKLCLCTQLVISGVLYPCVAHWNDIIETDELVEEEIGHAINQLSIAYPGLKTQLVDERDEYMVHKLRLMASRFSLVVAVVGAGHVPGIIKNWNKQIDIDKLCEMPEKEENLSNIWNYTVIGISVVGILGWSIYKYRRYKFF